MAKLGTVILLPTSVTLSGFVPCDGRLFNISSNQVIFTAIGRSFGGNGINTFALPQLSNKFGCHHLICIDGEFSIGVKDTVDFDESNYLGTVAPFDDDAIPDGWALCDGSQHSYDENPSLAHILGTFQVAGKSGTYFEYPNSGSERYIICTKGEYPE